LRAEGTVVASGKQICTAEARVLAADGRLVAHGTSTLMILRPRG
jgi:acyl-coenzyme A thioesterase PaaI-like protein